MNVCTQCGMDTEPNEYHPYAACLMHLACRNSKTVRENMESVMRDIAAVNLRPRMPPTEEPQDIKEVTCRG